MSTDFERELAELETPSETPARNTRITKRNMADGNTDPESLKEQVLSILSTAGSPDSFTLSLSKFDPEKNSWPQITKFQNITPDNVPDADSIGKKYGGGKYQLFLRWKDKDKKSGYALETRTFELHAEYDKYLKGPEKTTDGLNSFKETAAILAPFMANKGSDMGPIVQAMMQQGQQSMQMMMTQMQQSQQMMLQQMQQASQQNMQMMMQMTQMMTAIITKPIEKDTTFEKLLPILIEKQERSVNPMVEFRENMQFLNELKGDSSSDKEESTVMQVAQMVMQFLPMLMDKAVDALKVKAMINANAKAREVLANPTQMQRIGQVLANQLTPEQMKTVSEKTGIPAPENKPELAAPVNGEVEL